MKTWSTLLFLIAATVYGQIKAQYRLDIRMLESGPAQTPPKQSTYMMVLQAGSRATLNASSRVAYYSAAKNGAKEVHTVALGTIFECSANEAEAGVRLDCAFESSFASKQAQSSAVSGFPAIQSRQARTTAVVPFDAESVVAELDDPTTGNRLQFYVTAKRFAGGGN